MRLTTVSSVALAALMMAACSTSKKNASVPAAPATPVVTAPSPAARPSNGVYAPGEEELTAIRARYPQATLKILAEGHALYTGVCTNCHGAKNIYNRSEAQWPAIMDDMARKAKLSEAQKDAVYQYVLAIKATQPKAGQR